jgi:hypothetical protein
VLIYRFKGLCLWVILGGLLFGEGAYVAPDIFVGHIGCARDTTYVVGNDIGSAWGWGGWPLIYGRGFLGVASDATDHTLILV